MGSHHSDSTLKTSLFLFVFGAGLIYKFLSRYRRKRRIEDLPTAQIASAPQGTVEFQGYAWPIKKIVSPFGEDTVCFYELVIEEERKSGKNSEWLKVFSDRTSLPFAIADTTGYAVIFPDQSTADLRKKIFYQKDISEIQRDSLQNLLQARGCRLELKSAGLFRRNWRVQLSSILVGSPLLLQGAFKTVDGITRYTALSDLGAFIDKVKIFSKNPVFDLRRFDSNYDGVISQDEWLQAHYKQALMSFKDETELDLAVGASPQSFSSQSSELSQPKPSGVIAASKENPLYMADCHQAELLRRLSHWYWLQLIGGALMISVGAALLYVQLILKKMA